MQVYCKMHGWQVVTCCRHCQTWKFGSIWFINYLRYNSPIITTSYSSVSQENSDICLTGSSVLQTNFYSKINKELYLVKLIMQTYTYTALFRLTTNLPCTRKKFTNKPTKSYVWMYFLNDVGHFHKWAKIKIDIM